MTSTSTATIVGAVPGVNALSDSRDQFGELSFDLKGEADLCVPTTLL
jgi:hypothetical protein